MSVEKIVQDPSLSVQLQISGQARDQAIALLRLTDEAKENGAEPSPDLQARIVKQQKHLITSISHLRGLHRSACLAARGSKAQTLEARQGVDRLILQKQNLCYEQQHLEDEIADCELFEHKYLQLPLIPVEDFLSQHPEHKDDNENDLMIARINSERADREALEQQRQERLKRKQKLIADNKRRKDDLASLDQDLERFIDAAKPIIERFEKAP